ncbi:MAG: FtsX-like permease family protein [Clostridia bacterium]|nr:FtsX-like permease family protein [Clostridia bacterium]
MPLKNLTRRPGRTAALVLLTAFLALSVFGGSVVVRSLRSGLDSLEARLGADIIVMPATAESKVSFKNMLLQGTTGAFYMDGSVLDRVREVEGVAVAAPQTFLASLKADCCAVKVQVIGIDPEVDFTVKPWIDRSTTRALGDMDVAVGCDVTADVGEDLRIYDLNTHVVAKLAETGTGLDTAVYCTMDTMRTLLAAAEAKGVTHKITSETDDLISAVYVKVAEGYDVGAVNNALNGHVRKATAVRSRSMFTDVSDSLTGISRTVSLLIGAVWALAFIILLIAFGMMANERRREFAVLRLLGASRGMLARLMLVESALCSLAGGLIGVGAAAVAVFPFATLIETRLGLPYLTPPAGTILALAAGTVLATLLVGALSSAWSAWRLSRTDVGITLREGA